MDFFIGALSGAVIVLVFFNWVVEFAVRELDEAISARDTAQRYYRRAIKKMGQQK